MAKVIGKNQTNFIFSKLFDLEQSTTPSNPVATHNRMYFKSDGRLYKLDSAGVEQLVGLSAPGVTTDNAVVRWDGTTGSAVQDSLVISDDAGRLNTGLGTELLPAYAFTADPDTGMYRYDNNRLAWTNGGVNKMFLGANYFQTLTDYMAIGPTVQTIPLATLQAFPQFTFNHDFGVGFYSAVTGPSISLGATCGGPVWEAGTNYGNGNTLGLKIFRQILFPNNSDLGAVSNNYAGHIYNGASTIGTPGFGNGVGTITMRGTGGSSAATSSPIDTNILWSIPGSGTVGRADGASPTIVYALNGMVIGKPHGVGILGNQPQTGLGGSLSFQGNFSRDINALGNINFSDGAIFQTDVHAASGTSILFPGTWEFVNEFTQIFHPMSPEYGIRPGMTVEGPGIQAGTVVTSITYFTADPGQDEFPEGPNPGIGLSLPTTADVGCGTGYCDVGTLEDYVYKFTQRKPRVGNIGARPYNIYSRRIDIQDGENGETQVIKGGNTSPYSSVAGGVILAQGDNGSEISIGSNIDVTTNAFGEINVTSGAGGPITIAGGNNGGDVFIFSGTASADGFDPVQGGALTIEAGATSGYHPGNLSLKGADVSAIPFWDDEAVYGSSSPGSRIVIDPFDNLIYRASVIATTEGAAPHLTPSEWNLQEEGQIDFYTNNIKRAYFDAAGNFSLLGDVVLPNQQELSLYELSANGNNAIHQRASSAMAADYTLTWPAAAPGTNTVLKFDGANYVWGVASTGSEILNGGNTFGSDITIGTNDAFKLNLETGGIVRWIILEDTATLYTPDGVSSPDAEIKTGEATTGTAGRVFLYAGSASGAGGTGGEVNILGGNADDPAGGDGGPVLITGGSVNGTGSAGGNIDIYGGNVSATDGGSGGYVYLQGGNTASDSANGGGAFIYGGNAENATAGNGGEVEILAGYSEGEGGGPVSIQAGNTNSITGTGGNVDIAAGNADNAAGGDAGSLNFNGGNAQFGAAGEANFLAGNSIDGQGGHIRITSGNSTNGTAGDVELKAGSGVDEANKGAISLFFANTRFERLFGRRLDTTDNTTQNLFTLLINDNETHYFTAKVTVKQTNGSNRAAYERKVLVYRDGGGAVIQGVVQDTFTEESNANWNCTWDVNSNDIRLRVTGDTSQDVSWTAVVEQEQALG